MRSSRGCVWKVCCWHSEHLTRSQWQANRKDICQPMEFAYLEVIFAQIMDAKISSSTLFQISFQFVSLSVSGKTNRNVHSFFPQRFLYTSMYFQGHGSVEVGSFSKAPERLFWDRATIIIVAHVQHSNFDRRCVLNVNARPCTYCMLAKMFVCWPTCTCFKTRWNSQRQNLQNSASHHWC